MMQIIRCTKKLQKEMGLKKADLVTSDPEFSRLGGWQANLLYIKRRKSVLFVNDKTLFNFIVPDVLRAHLRDLSLLFKANLACVISDADFSESVKAKILSEYDSIGYGKTNNKSVLGSMKDLAFHYKYYIESSGGIHSPEVPGIIRDLNHIPMGALEEVYSIKALKALYPEEYPKYP